MTYAHCILYIAYHAVYRLNYIVYRLLMENNQFWFVDDAKMFMHFLLSNFNFHWKPFVGRIDHRPSTQDTRLTNIKIYLFDGIA